MVVVQNGRLVVVMMSGCGCGQGLTWEERERRKRQQIAKLFVSCDYWGGGPIKCRLLSMLMLMLMLMVHLV